VIQSILIGLDGSTYSESALQLGLRWARRTGARLTGIGIIDEPTICRPEPTGIGGGSYKRQRDECLLKDAQVRVAGFLEHFANRCTEAGVPHRVLQDAGLPSERILFEAEDFDLTLLGQRTYFHFETQTQPDETLEAVLRKGHRSIVAVGETVPESRSVVIAYDASRPAVRALEAFANAGLDQWEMVRVVSLAKQPAVAARRAEEGAKFLRAHNLQADSRPAPVSRPVAESLLEQVRELGAGMLVMGAFGRSRLAESFTGSTTRAVLENSTTPVFLHH
jgi:nucleotide-binding universal stress UspA family protein